MLIVMEDKNLAWNGVTKCEPMNIKADLKIQHEHHVIGESKA